MIIAPLADNLLTAGTWLDSANLYELEAGPANLTDADPLKTCRPRGTYTVTANVNDDITGNDGAPFVATIAAGTYSSPQELAVATMAALNAASSNWLVHQSQIAATACRWILKRSSGTASLDPTVADSALRYLFGFRAEARTAAASHTGDFSSIHAPRQDLGTCDLATAKPATAAIFAGIDASAGAALSVSMGTTTAATDATWYTGEAFEGEAVYLPFAAATYRYARFTVTDPRRDDRARIGCGYTWYGVPFDTDRSNRSDRIEWEVSSYQRSGELRSILTRMRDGSLVVSEVEPGERIKVGFNSRPGLSPGMMYGLRVLLRSLGNNALALVCFDTRRPATMTRLCRVVSAPTFESLALQSAHGRWSLALEFAVERT